MIDPNVVWLLAVALFWYIGIRAIGAAPDYQGLKWVAFVLWCVVAIVIIAWRFGLFSRL